MTKPRDHNDPPNEGLPNLNELPADDNELGELLGRSMAERVAGPEPIPQTAQVYELAARTQRRQRITAVAAGALLVVGIAGVGISQLSDAQPQDITTIASTPEPESTAVDQTDNSDSANDDASGTNNSSTDTSLVETASLDLLDPADFSDGPALTWTEVDLPDGLGSGRVVGHTDTGQAVLASAPNSFAPSVEVLLPSSIWLTSDGTDWEPVDNIPKLAFVQQAVRSGGVWYVVGAAIADNPQDIGIAETLERGHQPSVFVSRDNGQTWSQIELRAAEPASSDTYVQNEVGNIDIAVRAGQAVVMATEYLGFDLDRYALDNNLIPEGKVIVGQGFTADSVELYVAAEAAFDPGSQEFAEPDTDPITIPIADLGIDDFESIVTGPSTTTLWHISAEGTVTEVLSAIGDGHIESNGTSFLYLNSFEDTTTWSSLDGLTWTEQQSGAGDDFFSELTASGENLLRVANRPDGSIIEVSANDGATWTTLRRLDRLSLSGISANELGLATTAFVNGPSDGSSNLLPAGMTVTGDGYVFVVNETSLLAELQTDDGQVIRTFGEEEMGNGDAPPEGIVVDEVTGDLSFLDPVTGEVLVVFTQEDFDQAFNRMADDLDVTSEIGMPSQWVGWSADGSQWHWIDAAEEFGTGPGAWVETATTARAVLAIVNDIGDQDGAIPTLKIFVGTP